MVVRVAFEVGFVCFIALKIYLRILKDSEWIFESAGDLLVD